MKKIFKEAHKMTKEMVGKYGVDYKFQFGLNLAYLLENKKEEVEMKEFSELLNQTTATEEQKQKAIEKFQRCNSVNKEKAEERCGDKEVRRRMKNAGLYTYEYGVKNNFLGEGKHEAKNLKLWNNYGKKRIYFDLYIDEVFATNTFIEIK